MDFNWLSGNGIGSEFPFMAFMLARVASSILNKRDNVDCWLFLKYLNKRSTILEDSYYIVTKIWKNIS